MLRSCIVGYGSIGPVHAKAIQHMDSARLYAVCDNDDKRAMACRDENDCEIYTDFEQMLKDQNIDVIHICTPHYLHMEMATKAIIAGKHVVLEKPVAMNPQELHVLCKIVSESNKKLCVMFQNRENPCIRTLKRLQREDAFIGKLLGVWGNLSWSRDFDYYKSSPWRGKWETSGGGVLMNQAIHLLDLMIYFGGEVNSVKSSISNKGLPEIQVEDTVDAVISFESGVKGIFNATNLYSINSGYRLELDFENAGFRYSDGSLFKTVNGETELIMKDNKMTPGKSYWGSGHEVAIKAFYDSIEKNENNFTGLSDVLQVMNTVFKIYEGASNKNIYK